MGALLYFCDLRGPTKPSLRTPWGSMDHRLRTYVLVHCVEHTALQLVVTLVVCISKVEPTFDGESDGIFYTRCLNL